MKLLDPVAGRKPDDKFNGPNFKKQLLKKQIIEIFYREGRKTIAELCEPANNSIPTITNVMNELAAEGWVKNFGIGESKGGRKPTLYGLNTGMGYIFAIDLSRKYTRMGIFDLNNESVGDILELSEGLDTAENILAMLEQEATQLLKKSKIKKDKILGFGIAVPGLIDIKNGVSYSYPQFGDQPLHEVFTRLFGRPSFVEHDTKTMALGELWFGLAKNISNALFVNIGSGIGLSMILNGELYHGHSGFSGEFGHIQMNPEGELCYCGKIGCLETIASGTALVKTARESIDKGKNSIISKLEANPRKIKLRTIIQAANQGDQFAIELLEGAGEYLARGIAILIHLFNPEVIIIGGEMAEAENLIKDPIQQKLSKYTMVRLKQDTTLLVSLLRRKAGLLGTLPVVMSNILSPETENGGESTTGNR